MVKIAKKNRCLVHPMFMEQYKISAEATLRQIFDRMHTKPEHIRVDYLKQKGGHIARLRDVTIDRSGVGLGVDLELTKLRRLPFYKLTAPIDENENVWFVAETRGLLTKSVSSRTNDPELGSTSIGDLFDLGDYKICVPVKDIGTFNIENIHFIPLNEPRAIFRHWHHYVHSSVSRDEYDAVDDGNPLEFEPYTCWGNFASITAEFMSNCDLAELFNMLYLFVHRYNPGSRLCIPYRHERVW